jgi:hypothetical protein
MKKLEESFIAKSLPNQNTRGADRAAPKSKRATRMYVGPCCFPSEFRPRSAALYRRCTVYRQQASRDPSDLLGDNHPILGY